MLFTIRINVTGIGIHAARPLARRPALGYGG
jgi:hypothetical protein